MAEQYDANKPFNEKVSKRNFCKSFAKQPFNEKVSKIGELYYG